MMKKNKSINGVDHMNDISCTDEKEYLRVKDSAADPFSLTEEEILRYSKLLAYAVAKAGSFTEEKDFPASLPGCRREGVR